MSKSSPWSRGQQNTLRKGSIYNDKLSGTKKKNWYAQKATSPKKRERSQTDVKANCVWLPGPMHNEERLNEGPWVQRKQNYENGTVLYWYKIKQRKENITPEKKTKCHRQTKQTKNVRRIQVRATWANQLWRGNQHVHACFGLCSDKGQ